MVIQVAGLLLQWKRVCYYKIIVNGTKLITEMTYAVIIAEMKENYCSTFTTQKHTFKEQNIDDNIFQTVI